MKTYQSGTKENKKRKNFFMRHIYAFILGFSVLAVGAIVTLTLVFSLPGPAAPIGGGDDIDPPPVNTNPAVVMPIEGATVGQGAALDKLVYWETLKQWRSHNGIDYIAPAGTSVVAIMDGTVKSVEDTMLEGKVVVIEHEDGYVSYYKSLANTTVQAGKTVKAGDKVGEVSNSMMTESLMGAHLHFELTKDGKLINPAVLLDTISGNK